MKLCQKKNTSSGGNTLIFIHTQQMNYAKKSYFFKPENLHQVVEIPFCLFTLTTGNHAKKPYFFEPKNSH